MFITGEIFVCVLFFNGGTSAIVLLPSDRKRFWTGCQVNIVEFNNGTIVFCFPKQKRPY